MANPNTLPKSLHTVTVLVTMARMLQNSGEYPTAYGALCRAADLLGYTVAMDTYGLLQQALKKMNRI